MIGGQVGMQFQTVGGYGRNILFRFVSSLYVLATLTHGLDDALVSLR